VSNPAATRQELLRTGRTAAPPEIREVRAGNLTAIFTNGDLRFVRRGPVEVVRRVYMAVRDLDWNTLPGEYEDQEIVAGPDSFLIRYTRRDRDAGIDYRWHAEITGTADGVITYRMRGTALTGFPYAKIGICVHHPVAGYAGQPFTGVAPGGPVSGKLPDAIGPQRHLDDGTDAPLFDPVRELELRHRSGGIVRFDFAGDLWEMEDQRNWTDASYKSASTPASLGYRHEAHRGQEFDQSVAIVTRGFPARPARAKAAAGRPAAAELRFGARAEGRVPPVGLGCSAPAAPLSPAGLAVLRAIAPAHLRVDVRPGSVTLETELAAAAGLARRVGCGLELAVLVPADGDQAALTRLRAALAAAAPPLARVLAFGEREESSSARTVAAVRAALGDPAAPVIGGTNIYFNELNRHRLPLGGADGLAWSVNPQIHAFDDLSLMENLQGQPDTVITARSFAPGGGLYVTPVTLRPRFNAVATTDAELSAGELPWPVDPRQPSLFAAAWTLGSVAALAGAGADGLTYYDTVGPRGVIESPDGSPWPGAFASRADAAYPLAIVLADACALGGRAMVPVRGADPAELAVLAAQTPAGATILMGNLTRQARQVTVQVGAGARGRVRVLDEHTARHAAADPAAFLRSGQEWAARAGAASVTLHPYGVARLDVHDE
jgi:hypothetical protein